MTENCTKTLLSNNDILALYENSMKLNHDSYTHAIIEDGECSTNQKSVSLSLMNEDQKISTLIERIYFKNYQLETKKEKGNVAYHKFFALNDNVMRKGIAKALHKSELSIYQNKIDEIQLNAICDGIISWIRLGFSFAIPDSKYLVYENLMTYLEEVKKIPDEELDDIESLFLNSDNTVNENAFREIEKDFYFLKGNNFTKWFLDQNVELSDDEDKKPTMKMYKRVKLCKEVA